MTADDTLLSLGSLQAKNMCHSLNGTCKDLIGKNTSCTLTSPRKVSQMTSPCKVSDSAQIAPMKNLLRS